MFGRIFIIGCMWLAATAAMADLVQLSSSRGVNETMDRFEEAVQEAGLKVFVRIDHGKGAGAVGLALRPTQLLIFGSPKVGGLLMRSNQRIGIDLPLKALVWQDSEGKVWLGYLAPADLLQRYAIQDRSKLQAKMTGLLARLARAATQP